MPDKPIGTANKERKEYNARNYLLEGTNVKASATLMATLVGTITGTGGWIIGLGKILWPEHPMLALMLVTIVSGIVTQIIVAREARRITARP